MTPAVTVARPEDLTELAEVAAATFPLACPPASTADDIAGFVAENLTAARFTDYLADPRRSVFVARGDARIVGYAMVIDGPPDDPDVVRAVTTDPSVELSEIVELSKIYVLPAAHDGRAAAELMGAAVHHTTMRGARCLWLGVNQQNRRAQRFYAKQGFVVAGTKTFRLGSAVENDFVMIRML